MSGAASATSRVGSRRATASNANARASVDLPTPPWGDQTAMARQPIMVALALRPPRKPSGPVWVAGRRATTAAWISPARTAKFGSPSTSVCTLRTPRTASASA